MPELNPRHVFVYGTLRRGECNDINRLAPAPRFVGMGSVRGALYRVAHYPGLVLGDPQARADGLGEVVGEVYDIAPALERVLDAIEEIVPGDGSEYLKRDIPIEVQGRRLWCLVYELNPRRVHGLARLPSGDWLDFTKRN